MEPSKRPRSEHPFRVFLLSKGRPQQWAVDRAAELGESLSQAHLSEIMSGAGRPSVSLLALLERISDGTVKAGKMLDWHLRHAERAA